MDNSIFLFAAFGITWSIIFLYVYRLYRSQKSLDYQISKIKTRLQKNVEFEDRP